MQTFCLLKNWMLYLNDIRLVGASMLVLYVLCNYPRQEERHLEELSRARGICARHTPANSRWWFQYLAFRDCLVTESDRLERFMICPGLGKAMLGVWWLADQGHPFTQQDLINICGATVTEFIGRAKLQAETFLALRQPASISSVDTDRRY
jgi:hypothetical protein